MGAVVKRASRPPRRGDDDASDHRHAGPRGGHAARLEHHGRRKPPSRPALACGSSTMTFDMTPEHVRSPARIGRRMVAATAACTALVLGTITCRQESGTARTGSDTGTAAAADDAPVRAVSVSVSERGSARIIGRDTLSDSARVVTVTPEPDGDAIAFTFADTVRGITAGLGIIDRRRAAAELIWPDSVMRAWWIEPHSLAFVTTTGSQGARVVVDVHAESLRTVERRPAATPRTDSLPPGTLDAARARATTYIDSIRVQPGGQPQRSQLRYAVTGLLPAPRDSLWAFHVIARGTGGQRVNPTWYALDLRTGIVQPIDSVVGSAAILPEKAAAWVDGERFVYAKGPTLHEARIVRIRSRG